MQDSNRENELIKALDRLIFIVVFIILVSLIIAYFAIPLLISKYPDLASFTQTR